MKGRREVMNDRYGKEAVRYLPDHSVKPGRGKRQRGWRNKRSRRLDARHWQNVIRTMANGE